MKYNKYLRVGAIITVYLFIVVFAIDVWVLELWLLKVEATLILIFILFCISIGIFEK